MVKPPHILLASSNVRRMEVNLAHVLDAPMKSALAAEIARQAREMFLLGQQHFTFAGSLAAAHWRQKISRYYYAAFNVWRAVALHVTGSYSQDVDDHKKVGTLPSDFPTRGTYEVQLPVLRVDRNMCDYDPPVSG